jgi:hypothetical protein
VPPGRRLTKGCGPPRLPYRHQPGETFRDPVDVKPSHRPLQDELRGMVGVTGGVGHRDHPSERPSKYHWTLDAEGVPETAHVIRHHVDRPSRRVTSVGACGVRKFDPTSRSWPQAG